MPMLDLIAQAEASNVTEQKFLLAQARTEPNRYATALDHLTDR
jgi:hypothetical protein